FDANARPQSSAPYRKPSGTADGMASLQLSLGELSLTPCHTQSVFQLFCSRAAHLHAISARPTLVPRPGAFGEMTRKLFACIHRPLVVRPRSLSSDLTSRDTTPFPLPCGSRELQRRGLSSVPDWPQKRMRLSSLSLNWSAQASRSIGVSVSNHDMVRAI